MNAILVRARVSDAHGPTHIVSVIGGRDGTSLLDQLQGGPLSTGLSTGDVRVCASVGWALRERERSPEDPSLEDVLANELADALAATEWADVETRGALKLPFWVADEPDCARFEQRVRVRIHLRCLAEHPDVEADLRWCDRLSEQTEELIAFVRQPEPDSGSAFIARRLARNTPIAVGALIACETMWAKALLHLVGDRGHNIFDASAHVCGMRPLVAGDILGRKLTHTRGGDTQQVTVGEIIAVE